MALIRSACEWSVKWNNMRRQAGAAAAPRLLPRSCGATYPGRPVALPGSRAGTRIGGPFCGACWCWWHQQRGHLCRRRRGAVGTDTPRGALRTAPGCVPSGLRSGAWGFVIHHQQQKYAPVGVAAGCQGAFGELQHTWMCSNHLFSPHTTLQVLRLCSSRGLYSALTYVNNRIGEYRQPVIDMLACLAGVTSARHGSTGNGGGGDGVPPG